MEAVRPKSKSKSKKKASRVSQEGSRNKEKKKDEPPTVGATAVSVAMETNQHGDTEVASLEKTLNKPCDLLADFRVERETANTTGDLLTFDDDAGTKSELLLSDNTAVAMSGEGQKEGSRRMEPSMKALESNRKVEDQNETLGGLKSGPDCLESESVIGSQVLVRKEEEGLEESEEFVEAHETLDHENVGVTVEDENAGVTVEDENAGVSVEDENVGVTVEDENVGVTVEDENAGVTVEDENAGVTVHTPVQDVVTTVSQTGSESVALSQTVHHPLQHATEIETVSAKPDAALILTNQDAVLNAASNQDAVLTNQVALLDAATNENAVLTNQDAVLVTSTNQDAVLDTSTNEDAVLVTPTNEDAVLVTSTSQSAVLDVATNQETADVLPSAPALLGPSEMVQLVCREEVEDAREVERVSEGQLYPWLDSIIEEQEVLEELTPFSEQELAVLYPNPQLETNPFFIDLFLQHSKQEHHALYELMMQYLKARQLLASTLANVQKLKSDYATHQQLLWSIETQNITSNGKCGDGTRVSHSHSHKFAIFKPEEAIQVNTALKTLREVLYGELCIRSYSSQLARIHIEHYLYQLLQSMPETRDLQEDAPVTSWVSEAPPGGLDARTGHLRDCISVLFMFERKPTRDKSFSEDCRQWLNLLLSALLRVATLSDHQFIFNHLLRCPPGVGRWAVKYLQLPSPLHTSTHHTQVQNTAANFNTNSDGVGMGLHRDWGGPMLDHFVTMLATLLLPIKERQEFLSLLEVPIAMGTSRQSSSPWTFVDEDLEEDDNEENQLLLKESDFISFFDQFPFTDLFQHILQVSNGNYSVGHCTSYQVLRLIAFCTCLIRLLGAAFSTLRLSRYKEFIKQVGRTIRQTVQYVADLWVTYKVCQLQSGHSLASLPQGEGGVARYSLNRLQLEFDHFVLRATRWILTAHKLGAWQFLADMPYGSISLTAVWKVFWSLYSNHTDPTLSAYQTASGHHDSGSVERDGVAAERGRSPETVEEIQQAMKNENYKLQFVDCLMKTYTSEAVFLLTTFVNMARARPADCDKEKQFINTIALEIFECTQVTEFARDAYSRTGCTLLDSIAIVHPFIMSTLIGRVESAVKSVGENCVLLFKELPLYLWVPESCDLQMVRHWLVNEPLTSFENRLARVIFSGLNWGTKSEDGSSELVLPWSMHRSVALTLVEAHACHLPSHPGGRDYTPIPTGLGKYASSSLQRFSMSTDHSEFVKWTWEVLLMLKLHPNQVITTSMQTLSPTQATGGHQMSASASSGPGRGGRSSSSGHSSSYSGSHSLSSSTGRKNKEPGARVSFAKDPRVYQRGGTELEWLRLTPDSDELVLPDLSCASERELAELRDAVKYEGLLAYYVAMSLTSIGTDTDQCMMDGLPMLHRLLDQGYYLPALRVLGNITPRFFKHKKILLENTSFLHVVIMLANADSANISLKERITFSSPQPLILRKMAALIQMQLQSACRPGGVGGDAVLQFWLDVLLSCPAWHRECSLLYLLDRLAMAAFSNSSGSWQKIIQTTLLESYRSLQPLHPRRSILSSVYSSVASIVGQEGGPPSLYNTIQPSEYPWLAYTVLCAEEMFEEEEGIWRALLLQLKKDPKASVDAALKKAFTDLKVPTGFAPSHLCIYRWAEFCTSIDHTHPLSPLIWQRFFMLYLQRPVLESSMPDRQSQGLRFFSVSRATTLRRRMKSTLSNTCKQLQASIDKLEREGGEETRDRMRTFLPACLKYYQTLRLWLEEPRLHDGSLYLPGLPPQYDSRKLEAVFQPKKCAPWLEFVPMWEVKGQLNTLVEEWMQVAAYQKTLPSKSHSHDSSPDTALTRIQKRLRKRVEPAPPPTFQKCQTPFSLLPENVLLSREALLAVVKTDMHVIVEQARMFSVKRSVLTTLDEEYMQGVSELYSNEPRQFHVRVPCHSRFNRSHQCSSPATIVFRFNEMTVNPMWDQKLQTNRLEYAEMLASLSSPVSHEFCTVVMRMEHTVSELSKLCENTPQDVHLNIPLQCATALFYEVLGFIDPTTRGFPPSCQFLTSCVQILGQEFVQRDPMQTSNILELLLSRKSQADLLAPLFKPNGCPDQFLHMYGSAAEVAVKDGASIAFSVLTKFNVASWLDSYDPNLAERSQMLDFISQGLTLCGPTPSPEGDMLVETYRHHFRQLVSYHFPEHYINALRLVIGATDSTSIVPKSWSDLCSVTGPADSPELCKLGLKDLQESLHLLSQHYLNKRSSSKKSLYSVISWQYIPLIGQFIHQLCQAMVFKWAEAVSMETVKHAEAIDSSWQCLVDAFAPWIATLQRNTPSQPAVSPPCTEAESGLLGTFMDLFVDCVSAAHNKLRDPTRATSIMVLLWQYYCMALALPNTSPYTMQAYHVNLVKLPWRDFLPDLTTLDYMTKLKLMDNFPPSSFIFLGRIFPQFNWKNIVAAYCDATGDPTAPVQFHIMLLQLLVMLAAEKEVMDQTNTGIPDLITEAHNFHWEYIDAKTYQDILEWQKNHCDVTMILQSGSCLSLALRLLKTAAGFPSSSGEQQPAHQETWEKRVSYIQVVVELVGAASHQKKTHIQSYSDPISHLFQTAVDVCVLEPQEQGSVHVISMLQEILNLLNICSPSDNILQKILDLIFVVLEQMPNAHLLTLPTITAGCRTLASLPWMIKVVEHAIECHFQAVPKPEYTTLQLPPNVNGYGWHSVTASLVMPEESTEEMCQACISECATLTLHAYLLQTISLCTSLDQEFGIALRVIQWCSQIKPKPSQEAKLLLIWEKVINLLLRQVRYRGNFSEVVPHLTSLATGMTRFGEDKVTEGILGAIGLGKKSCYSHQFRLISRAMAAFLHCQMPVDSSQSTQLRVVPNAPGHVKDPSRNQANLNPAFAIIPTKQGDQACNYLESLLNNKQYTHLKEHILYSINFVNNMNNSVMNSIHLLVHLCTTLYPECRFLDVLRTLQL